MPRCCSRGCAAPQDPAPAVSSKIWRRRPHPPPRRQTGTDPWRRGEEEPLHRRARPPLGDCRGSLSSGPSSSQRRAPLPRHPPLASPASTFTRLPLLHKDGARGAVSYVERIRAAEERYLSRFSVANVAVQALLHVCGVRHPPASFPFRSFYSCVVRVALKHESVRS
jgi:hypothetical protein